MKHWKDELKQGFNAPEPLNKKAFLRKIGPTRMTTREFLFTQISYISKLSWCVAFFVFITAILGLTLLPNTVIWLISGLTPLLALTIISESGRSELYKMAELEMATRFSLRSVTFARLGILGLMNLFILGIFVLIGLWNGSSTPFAVLLYIITPYLLTTFTGLSIVRKFNGQEALYGCVGVAIGISIALFFSHNVIPIIYQKQWLVLWAIVAMILLPATGKQCIAMIKQTEEYTWNLSLTD